MMSLAWRASQTIIAWYQLRQIILKSVSIELIDRRKTAKNLADNRKNWKFLTVSRK